MASGAPLSPAQADELQRSTPPPMGTAASQDASVAAASFAVTAPSSSTAVISGRNEIAFAQTAAEAAAVAASVTAAVDDVAEEARATEEEEEEEAGDNEGAASNPSSGVDEGELEGMAADGVILPSSDSAPTWRSAFEDPVPTPIKDEWVLLSSHIARGFSLPPSAFMLEILDDYGL